MALSDIKSIADEQTLSKGRINESSKTSSASTQHQALLKALKNIIVQVMEPMQTNDTNDIQLEPEAERLITALQEFISSVIKQSQPQTPGTIKINLDKEKDKLPELAAKQGIIQKVSSSESVEDAIANINSNPSEKPQQAFEERLLKALRYEVFNTIPIRLLCFEPHGSNLQISLLERGTIFSRLESIIRGKMNEEEFRPQKMQWGHMESDEGVIKRLITKYTKYAILSHTWLHTASGSEVTYADWNKGLLDSKDPGYQKLVKFCKAAWEDHQLTFGWMDTVCINKDSSSELDESIRSMYNWYNRAGVCIIYLAATETLSNIHSDPWFKRGWTLQEMLAPDVIKFYNGHWRRLVNHSFTDKNATEITEQIEKATTITKDELFDIRGASISRRMQLAAAREVTRDEDTAYSLMGILNVSISTAYGEGAPRAFSRLLQEILVSTTDVLDILNWAGELPASATYTSHILPTSPKYYINRSSTIGIDKFSQRFYWHGPVLGRPIEPLTLTHLGLRVPVILMPGISIHGTTPRYEPFGDYNASVSISAVGDFNGLPTTYSLLDKRITGPEARQDQGAHYQTTFAVFNFSETSNDIYQVPKTCIAIGLWSDQPFAANDSSTSGNFRIIQTDKPIVFELNNIRTKRRESNTYYWPIKRDKVASHGMQQISLYF